MKAKPLGNRGSWFAKLDGETLPCVHEHWTKDGRYYDPGCMPGVEKWPRFINAIGSGRKVILTQSKVTAAPQRKSGVSLSRQKYLSVWEVSGVEADDDSLRFNFVRKLRDIG